MTTLRGRPSGPAGRVPSGVPGLDVTLGGGYPAGRATLVAGTSGSGKTVLGMQFLAAGGAGPGEPAVLITFDERPSDLIANVASFGWDLGAMADRGRLAVVDATPEEGVVEVGCYDLGGLMARTEHALARTGATRLLIDALDAAFVQFGDARTVRRELAQLVGRLRDRDLTTLITVERVEEYGPVARRGVEEFVADNVIVLRNALDGRHRRRTVEVLKLRGYPHNKGEYAFVIDPRRGVEVVPVSAIESERPATTKRMSLGLEPLDAMVGGGAYRDSLLLVSGATGTGKSLLACHFLAAALAAGERALLLSFEENASQVVRNAAACGIDLGGAVAGGRLRVVSRFPERMGLEDLLVAIRRDVEEHRPQRVVIDSLTALEQAAGSAAFRDLVVGVSAHLKAEGIGTMVLTSPPELMGATTVTGAELSTLTDGIILLRYLDLGGVLRRVLVVLKMRGIGHDRAFHEYRITDRGLEVLGPIAGIDSMLGGRARPEVS